MSLVPVREFVRPCHLALALALAAGALFAGCGGSGGGEDEEALRSKLEKAFEKTDSASSIEISDLYKIDLGEDDSTGEDEVSGCLDLTLESGKGNKEERFDMRAYNGDCAGGTEGGEMILVGTTLWTSGDALHWSQAEIDPKLIPQLTSDTLDFSELPGAASDIREGEAGTYEFTAPASTFSDEPEADTIDVDFEAVTDKGGYLRSMVATIESEGAQAIVEQGYEDIGSAGPVKPPAASDVIGPIAHVHSESDLDELVAQIIPEQF